MQVVNDGTGTYRSMGRAFRKVLRAEGFFGLYQGMGPALFAASGSWGGYFYFYEKSKLRKQASAAGGELTSFDHVGDFFCIVGLAGRLLTIYPLYYSAIIWRRSGRNIGADVQSSLGGQDETGCAGCGYNYAQSAVHGHYW